MTRHTESNEQIAAMDWLREQHPHIAEHTMHIGNERKASYFAGFIMKKGVLKGASDLFMAWPLNGFHGLFIEVKSKIGKPTLEQKAFIERMRIVGYRAEICYGAEEVINTMQEYFIQKGTSESSNASS
jgi:hypothetical protein